MEDFNWDECNWAGGDCHENIDLLFDHFLEDGNTVEKMLSIIRNDLPFGSVKLLYSYLTEGDNSLPMCIYHNKDLRRRMIEAVIEKNQSLRVEEDED
uniref:Uncharacterized protein n=1 Tax=viral metagenome TaxID=1070528 RepID=A0A6C0KCS4_9ZZZZ